MANQWLRLWHDMPNDPKWRTISLVSGQPIALVQAVYIHLLVSASQSVTRGHIDVTDEDLASHFGVTEENIQAVISAMQGRVLEGKYLTGWSQRQPKKEDCGNPETGAKSATQRKREQRERERNEKNQADVLRQSHDASRTVTTDKDKIKRRKDIKDPPISPPYDSAKPVAFDPLAAELPEWLPAEAWASWVLYRKEIKKTIKSKQTVTQAINTLSRGRDLGYPPEEIINRSIGNGWQGLFEPKEPRRSDEPVPHWNSPEGWKDFI